MPIQGFYKLTDDEYIELASTINRQLKLAISADTLTTADYHLALERSQGQRTEEPKPKRIKNAVLDNSKYSELSTAFKDQLATNITNKDIAFMDITLQNHRSISLNRSLSNQLPLTGLNEPTTVSAFPTPQQTNTPPVLRSQTATTPIKTENRNDITPINRKTLFPSTKTFEWQATPTGDRNHCIAIASFLKTIPTVYPTAKHPIELTCKYEHNPKVSLQALLTIMGATVPTSFLDQMFAIDYTVRSNTINSIFKNNKAEQHFQFSDYATMVANRNLPSGLTPLFTGASGGNFSGPSGFTTDTPILCQMEMAAPDRSLSYKKSYQWILFFPRMNLIATCHDYNDKHVWTLGKETIAALSEENESFINTRLGKLAFPHKQDNVKSCKFISAVFVAPKNSNFEL